MKSFDYVILGGGVAGLCAAKRLLELGICPLIIEAGQYPMHKVCGEFLSPSSLPILEKWEIQPIPIQQIEWHTISHHLYMPFRHPAGGLSHITLDPQLANQVSQQGATLLTQTKVLNLSPPSSEQGFHQLVLSSGENIQAKHLLIATGRLLNDALEAGKPCYMGFKAHFSGLDLNSTLHMFSFPGAYLGIAPVENGSSNLACLAKIENVQQFSSSQAFMQHLIASHPILSQLLAPGVNLFDHWMKAVIPEFGWRLTPSWPRTYWIGDAAMTIPPASGNGLSLAIASGYLAAEFAAIDDPHGFKQMWRKRWATKLKIVKYLHHLFLNPTFGSAAIQICKWMPSLAQGAFALTRDQGVN